MQGRIEIPLKEALDKNGNPFYVGAWGNALCEIDLSQCKFLIFPSKTGFNLVIDAKREKPVKDQIENF